MRAERRGSQRLVALDETSLFEKLDRPIYSGIDGIEQTENAIVSVTMSVPGVPKFGIRKPEEFRAEVRIPFG